MDLRYHAFAEAHPHYYEKPGARTRAAAEPGYRVTVRAEWGEWERNELGADWVSYRHPSRHPPAQGWKLHVSATHENAARLLDAVSTYCHEQLLPFKHLPDPAALHRSNQKYADRGSSGKFITIYPADAEEARHTLEALDAMIGGEAGPYILSDLRYREGPLYLRYGAHTLITTISEGRVVPALTAPAGARVPDLREPRFTVPEWVNIPEWVTEQLAAQESGETFPYLIERALHHSNGGGVYLARAITPQDGVATAGDDGAGETVILKEARPHAGLGPDRSDAVTRLRHEEAMLQQLAGVPGVVRYRHGLDHLSHRFAVLDRVPGVRLASLMARKAPTIRAHRGAAGPEHREYREWALDVAQRVEVVIGGIHAAGVCYGDLHPGNVLVDDRTPTLIDFETAHTSAAPPERLMGAPGYVAVDGRRGVDADRYSLACLTLALFVPLTILLPLDPGKAAQLVEWAHRRYELPAEYRAAILAELAPRPAAGLVATVAPPGSLARAAQERLAAPHASHDPAHDPASIPRLQRDLASGIAHTADFGRRDRAYPADIAVFAATDPSLPPAGIGLAHGAAGVLLALQHAGQPLDETAIDWLIAEATERLHHPGLLDGIGGTVLLLRRLGQHDAADRLSPRLLTARAGNGAGSGVGGVEIGDSLGDDLHSGLAGLALASWAEHDAHLARSSGGSTLLAARFAAQADAAMRLLRERESRRPMTAPWPKSVGAGNEGAPTVQSGRGGLLHGPSGVALAALRGFIRGGDERDLTLAEATVQRDLAYCVTLPDGSLQMNEGWRAMPYLATGSAGVGLVLIELLAAGADHGVDFARADDYRESLDGILLAAQSDFVIQPGLWHGRAGLIVLLSAALRQGHGGDGVREALRLHLCELPLHGVRHGAGIAFPGEQLLRLSSDLATGTAGVLYALEEARRARSWCGRTLPG